MPWNFTDPFPGVALGEIIPLSARALSWLARASNDSSFPQQLCVKIAGGARMLSGLDYHHANFIERVNRLRPYFERQSALVKQTIEGLSGEPKSFLPTDSERTIRDSLHHEAVAYLNRLGQFYKFAKASKVEFALLRASELMLFRHKHTAHRSIDDPHKDDDPHLQEVHATAFGFHQLSVDSFPVFQIHNHQTVVDFHMRDDHPIVMLEAFTALQAIHPARG